MIDDDPRLRRCFPKPSMVAYKRPKNLRDLLVKSKFQTGKRSIRKSNGFSRCGRRFFGMCKTCELIPDHGIKITLVTKQKNHSQ